jgi:hypothetical protein
MSVIAFFSFLNLLPVAALVASRPDKTRHTQAILCHRLVATLYVCEGAVISKVLVIEFTHLQNFARYVDRIVE